jgi:hypothetical protein
MATTPLRVEGLRIKKESSYGVDPTPTIDVRAKARIWPSLKPRFQFANRRDDTASGTWIVPKPGVPKGGLMDIEILWELKGKGSAYAASTDLEADPLFQACGLSVAVVTTGGSETVTYTPVETGIASCTIYAYAGGLLYILTGCRGNVIWPLTAGEQGEIRFVMTGMLVNDPATTAIPSASYNTFLPPAAVGCAFTLNGGSSYTPNWMKGAFDLGNDVQVIEDGSGTDGLAGIEIVGRMPKWTCTIRKDSLTSYNPRSLYKAVTSHTIALTLGSAQYNRLKLAVTESYLADEGKPVEYRGFAGYDLTYDIKAGTLLWD